MAFSASAGANGVLEGSDIGGGVRVYGNQDALSALRIRFGPDTLVFTPRRAAGELAVTRRDTLLMVLRVHGALAPVLREPSQSEPRGTEPILLEGTAPGLRIRFLIQSGHWMPSDSSSRSANGILLVSPR